MWSSVANLKESLSKIALEVHDDDDDEELSVHTPQSSDRLENGNLGSQRRLSGYSRRSTSITPSHSPIPNGFVSPPTHEIEHYKKEIKRLQDSEAEVKALSVNYAALLKEKEDEIARLSVENGSLKHNLSTTNAALSASKSPTKGGADLSPSRPNKVSPKFRSTGSPHGIVISPKQDGFSNGSVSTNGKELADALEDKNRSLEAMQARHGAQMKEMVMELNKGRDKMADMQSRLQEEQKLNKSFQQELRSLKDANDKMMKEIRKTRDELSQKVSDTQRLQMELQRRNMEEKDGNVEKLRKAIVILENENNTIKKEKDEVEAALKAVRSSSVHKDAAGEIDLQNKPSGRMNEVFPGKEEMEQSLHKLEKELKDAVRDKDKALQQLNRLKQHLLEKESEESEKMDEDSKIIEELREINERQRLQISRLDYSLKQAIRDQEEIKVSSNNELTKAKEVIDELNRKLTSCMATINAKNMEVLNLQTALGQYYAEIEAKERLGEELSVAKEESARLSEQLKEAHKEAEVSIREKVEVLGKLSQAERMLVEGKNRVKKVEEDNEKLRRALEQSMTRLNRMSVDSDFLVDRRIVIKLLVTYFQRNHSKEVLDLMVRMLGFTDDDKQRIGLAQQGNGKGVVRGVLGFPGRLVGGILGSGSEASTAMAPDDQSFADLWVDFLLKETEREKREAMEAANGLDQDPHKGNQNTTKGSTTPPQNYSTTTSPLPSTSIPNSSPYIYQNQIPSPSHGNPLHREPSDSEFSTVPLSSSSGNLQGQGSRWPPRY